MSALPPKADINGYAAGCPLLTQSGHWPDEVDVVLADVAADRRRSIGRFAGHGSCSFCYLHPKSQGASRSTVGPSH